MKSLAFSLCLTALLAVGCGTSIVEPLNEAVDLTPASASLCECGLGEDGGCCSPEPATCECTAAKPACCKGGEDTMLTSLDSAEPKCCSKEGECSGTCPLDKDSLTVSTEAEPKCCGKDGKCCKEGEHTHAVSAEAAEPKCCGKDGKCCKEGEHTHAVSAEAAEPKCCGKDGKCCKEGEHSHGEGEAHSHEHDADVADTEVAESPEA